MFLKNRNIISKIKRSKVTDYAALKVSNARKKMIVLNVQNVRSSFVRPCFVLLDFYLLQNLKPKSLMATAGVFVSLCSMSAVFARICKQGWEMHVYCFHHVHHFRPSQVPC